MDRRTVLKQIGGAGAIGALAGCVGVQEQGSTETPASDGGDDSADSDTETSGPAGEATVWYSLPDTEKPTREAVIQEFNDQSRHTIEGADISDMEQRTTTAIPSGQGAPAFEWAHDWVGDYLDRGFVVDKSDAISVSLDTFTSAAREAIQFDGNVVGLPHDAETVTLIYNTDIVDEAPETAEEMVSAMEEFHDPDSGQYGLSQAFNDPYQLSGWLQAFGGYYFDPDADPALGVDSDETIQGLEWALENLRPYTPNDPNYEPQAAAFAEGNAAFAVNGPWYLNTLNQNDVNYEVTTFPTIDGNEPNPYTGITMWYFTSNMAEDSAETTAALDFIEWFVTNEDHMIQNAEEQGAIPVLQSLVGSDELPAEVQAFSQSVDQGTPMPTDPRMNKVWAPLETALANAFNGDATAEEALTSAADDIRSNWE